MPQSTVDHERDEAEPQLADRLSSSESTRHFEAERLDELRKRYASHSLWAGLLGLLLLLIPNPVPWLLGPVAIVLGIHALIRIWLQPGRYAGTFRALVGIGLGMVAGAACRPWSQATRYARGRAVCKSNLREIARGLRQYHEAWQAYPPSLQALIEEGDVLPSQSQCFLEERDDPTEPDFAYVVGLQPSDPRDWIWVFDDPANHNGRGGIILYLSGETVHFGLEDFVSELRRFREEFERERGRPPVILGPTVCGREPKD